VHSLKLAAEIDKLCRKKGKVMDILVEVNVGNEESKSGFSVTEVESAILEMAKMQGIRVKGLMSIPPICEKVQELRQYFAILSKLFIDIKAKKVDNVDIVYLSMGMSGDFEDAIRYGANIVRIGTSLFGPRNYNK
jgi:pyridoxal phosphate enzyme (YggS family)